MPDYNTIWRDLSKIRENSPLVHNITNYVVMNSTANVLLSLGASPVMAHAAEEVEEMVAIASALVINIGTLSEKWIDSMLIAGKAAHEKGIPLVLDPVGAGATNLRTSTALEIIELCKPTIIRGNASEIMALVKSGSKTKGVDSVHTSDTALDYAKELAHKTAAIVSVSGQTDYITNGKDVETVNNGSPIMPKVTGMGCAATSITGAFAAINDNYLEAAANAMALMGIAGEMAEEISKGPGTLQLNFYDALFNLNEEDIINKLK